MKWKQLFLNGKDGFDSGKRSFCCLPPQSNSFWRSQIETKIFWGERRKQVLALGKQNCKNR